MAKPISISMSYSCYYFAEMNYIQFTGWPSDEGIVMEVIDNSGQSRLCQKDESKYPLEVYRHCTATYTNGSILACGGAATARTDQCYIFEKNQGWKQLSKMNQARSRSASIPIDGGMMSLVYGMDPTL